MATNNMFGMDGFDAEQARYERNNRLNPAEFAPGMEETTMDDAFGNNSFGNDLFGGGDSFGNDTFGGSGGFGNDPFGGSGGFGNDPFGATQDAFGTPQNNFNMGNQQPVNTFQNYTEAEDKVIEAIGTAGKESINFIKEIVTAQQQVTPLWYALFGKHLAIYSGASFVIGLVTLLFKLTKIGYSFMLAGTLGAFIGIVNILVVDMLQKKHSYDSLYKEESPSEMDMTNDFAMQSTETFDQDFNTDFSDMSDDFDTSEEENIDLFDTDTSDDTDDDIWGNVDISEQEQIEETPTVLTNEEALARLPEIPPHMYTRQYLLDAICQRLPNMKKDFSYKHNIEDDDEVFLYWEQCLREAAEVSGCKPENLPTLETLQETMFTIILTCTRPSGFKADVVANELASQYSYKEDGTFRNNVFANAKTVGKKCIITIFTGESAMVSLKDMIDVERDWILDPKNKIPVIFGIDQVGNVIKADAKSLESIIITGMPRSGKSWFVKAVILQMCMLNSASELQFFICDPKDGISDFKLFSMCMPQVTKFVANDNAILDTVRQVVKVEGPRRKKIIGEAGFVNIWDYKEAHPEVEMPTIYVVIDEVVTLAERMEKEIKQEFQGLLVELISQLPALGIRCMLVPHVIKDQIIAKTATDLVPCKISIMGDADHIEKATGSKYKDFPYKLANKGDMAVKMTVVSPNTMYVHAPVISDSNPENDNIFKYLQVIWNKIEPDTKQKEVMENEVEEQIAMQTVSNDIDTSSLSDDDLFGSNSLFD